MLCFSTFCTILCTKTNSISLRALSSIGVLAVIAILLTNTILLKRLWAHEVLIFIRFKSGSELLWISPLAAAIAIVLFITPPLWQSAIKKSRIFYQLFLALMLRLFFLLGYLWLVMLSFSFHGFSWLYTFSKTTLQCFHLD